MSLYASGVLTQHNSNTRALRNGQNGQAILQRESENSSLSVSVYAVVVPRKLIIDDLDNYACAGTEAPQSSRSSVFYIFSVAS